MSGAHGLVPVGIPSLEDPPGRTRLLSRAWTLACAQAQHRHLRAGQHSRTGWLDTGRRGEHLTSGGRPVHSPPDIQGQTLPEPTPDRLSCPPSLAPVTCEGMRVSPPSQACTFLAWRAGGAHPTPAPAPAPAQHLPAPTWQQLRVPLSGPILPDKGPGLQLPEGTPSSHSHPPTPAQPKTALPRPLPGRFAPPTPRLCPAQPLPGAPLL